MKGYIKVIAIFMVLLLLLSTVFGYNTDTFGDAVKGFEGTLSFVGSVGETTLNVITKAGSSLDYYGDAFEHMINGPNYTLPLTYAYMCGDTENGYDTMVYADLTQEYYTKVKKCKELLGDVFELDRLQFCNRNTATAFYLSDLNTIVNKTEGGYDAFLRIERGILFSNSLLFLRWHFTRQKIIDQYSSLLSGIDFNYNPSLEVMIMKYEFDKDYKLDANGNLVQGVSAEWFNLNGE